MNSPGFENRCEKTLNEGRHVCLLAKDHDGDCRPMVNAPWPPVPSGDELLERIRKYRDAHHIVLTTGSGTADIAEERDKHWAWLESFARSVPSGEARETMFRDVWDFAQRAYVLLDNLTDEEECRRDHHGACQTHLGERDCSNARAIALLDQYSERFDEIEEALPLAASSPSPSSVPKDTTG